MKVLRSVSQLAHTTHTLSMGMSGSPHYFFMIMIMITIMIIQKGSSGRLLLLFSHFEKRT